MGSGAEPKAWALIRSPRFGLLSRVWAPTWGPCPFLPCWRVGGLSLGPCLICGVKCVWKDPRLGNHVRARGLDCRHKQTSSCKQSLALDPLHREDQHQIPEHATESYIVVTVIVISAAVATVIVVFGCCLYCRCFLHHHYGHTCCLSLLVLMA